MYIGEAARRAGTTVKSIRHYERIGLLPAAPRAGSYRVYDQQCVNLISLIKCAQQLGFSLAELHALQHAQPGGATLAQAQQALAGKQAALQVRIDDLQHQQQLLSAFAERLGCEYRDCFPT